LIVVERQAITDPDHALYAQTKRTKGLSESMYMYAETQRVEGRVAPRRTPNLLRGNDTVRVTREPRENQKFLERKRNPLSTAGDVIVVVLDAEVAVIVDVRLVIVADE
jgi:hypothetical protein